MTAKIYHDTKELIVMEKPIRGHYAMDASIQDIIRWILTVDGRRADTSRIYDAHEIWFYNEHTKLFEAYKNKSGTSTLLGVWMEEEGVDVRCTAASIKDGTATMFRFSSDKDLFVFNLKFK